MIANGRQCPITKREPRNFEGTVATLLTQEEDTSPGEAPFRRLRLDAMRSQIADLRAEVGEDDALKDGERPLHTGDAFDRLPQAPIAARIAAGLTRAALAKRLGIHVQQVQRYEASGHAAASTRRVGEVVRALGVGVRIEIAVPPKGANSAD